MPESLTTEERPCDDFLAQHHEQDADHQQPSMRPTVTRVGDIDPANVYRVPTHGSGNCPERLPRAAQFVGVYRCGAEMTDVIVGNEAAEAAPEAAI